MQEHTRSASEKPQIIPFCQREFVDITQNYSDRLANIGALRRGKPTTEIRPKVVIKPELPEPTQPKRKAKRFNFNRGIEPLEGVVRAKKQQQQIDYPLAFAICRDIALKVDLRVVAKRHGIGYSTVKRIKNKGTKLAIRCFTEIENGAKRPTL
ncbi:MAG: hypothetical protein ACRDBQ_23260 [Shewanella sp.]